LDEAEALCASDGAKWQIVEEAAVAVLQARLDS
jgi:hypothetical protein